MKTNRSIVVLVAMSTALALSAQTTFDAAKVYEEELNGTARYVGMGGAMGAFGSDASVMSHNPAGIGTYRQGDINVSLSFFGSSVNTDPLVTSKAPALVNGRTFYSHNRKSDLTLVPIDNFSFVLCGKGDYDSYLNFGVSFRRTLKMIRELDYIDSFFDADGYEVYREYKDHQTNEVKSFDINLSYNHFDKLYFGMTLGLLDTDTWSEGYFYDYYPKGSHPDFPDGLDYTVVDKMNTAEGKGWNMAFGMIVRPVSALRFGAALKTPTLYRQKLEYADYLYALAGEKKDGTEKYKNSVKYNFASPFTLDLSAGLTVGQTALGFEYEMHFVERTSLSIGNSKMHSQGAIDMKNYSKIRVGIEQNIDKFSLRAGYNFTESMFKDGAGIYLEDSDFNRERSGTDFQVDRLGETRDFTCGLGYCSAPNNSDTQFYFDVAFVHRIRNSVVNVNEYIEDVDVNYQYKSNKVLLTFGWNF